MKKTLLLFAVAFGCASSLLAQAIPQGVISCPSDYDVSTYFGYTGATETYIVPPGVGTVFITANAPSGGDGVSNSVSTPTGGAGGFVQGYLSVTPGEVLYVTVGQRGQDAAATGNTSPINAFNGGGSGGYSAAGGSGATDIRRGGNTLANRIMVAGGGGGAGSNGCGDGFANNPLGGNGGNAGTSGTAGENGAFSSSIITGGDGGQIGATAAAGIGCNIFPGSIGELNGNGGEGPSFNACLPNGRLGNGGGGGGGYVQGGGGGSGAIGTLDCSSNVSSGGGGGAGGTNYLSSDFFNTNTSFVNASQGSVYICYSSANVSTINISNSSTSFTMSPNPTTGVLVLNNLTIGKNFRLVNALGQLVKSFEATSTQMTIDITAQPAGTYFLQSEGQAFSIIKQ